jgi:uncharacterized membrane protein
MNELMEGINVLNQTTIASSNESDLVLGIMLGIMTLVFIFGIYISVKDKIVSVSFALGFLSILFGFLSYISISYFTY